MTEYSRITSRFHKQENEISKLRKHFLTDPGIFEAIRRPIRLRDRYSNTHHSELLLKKMSPPFVSTCPNVSLCSRYIHEYLMKSVIFLLRLIKISFYKFVTFAFCHIFIRLKSWVTFTPVATIFIHALTILTKI